MRSATAQGHGVSGLIIRYHDLLLRVDEWIEGNPRTASGSTLRRKLAGRVK
jgi:hypothetical protein